MRQQRAGAHEPRDKAQVEGGAGVPVREVPADDSGRRHVRPGGDVVGTGVSVGII